MKDAISGCRALSKDNLHTLSLVALFAGYAAIMESSIPCVPSISWSGKRESIRSHLSLFLALLRHRCRAPY